jgi:hypothetical protein
MIPLLEGAALHDRDPHRLEVAGCDPPCRERGWEGARSDGKTIDLGDEERAPDGQRKDVDPALLEQAGKRLELLEEAIQEAGARFGVRIAAGWREQAEGCDPLWPETRIDRSELLKAAHHQS